MLSDTHLFGCEVFYLGLCLVFAYFLVGWAYNIWFHPLAQYPGPLFSRTSNLPLVWNLVRGYQCIWTKDLHKTYGPVVRCAPNELSYATGEAWQDIYVDEKMCGQKFQGFYRPDNPQFQNILGADNDTHAELRKIFNPAFSEKSLRSWEPMFMKVTTQMVNQLRQCCQKKSEPIDMGRFFMYVTFDIMGEFTLDQSLGMVEKMEFPDWIAGQYKNMKITAFMASASYLTFLKPLVAAFSWLMLEQMSAPFHFAIEQVDKRMNRPNPEAGSDIWSLTFKESKSGRKLTRYEMYTHALLLFTAGTETSATAMTGVLYYLAKHPEVNAKLKDEIRSAFKSSKDINLQSCSGLKYLQACIEETLRIYPPIKIGFPRITPPQGRVLDGQFVPGGTVVYVTQFASNLYPDNWKSPDKFIPERWYLPEYESDKRGARQPFSCGPRNCIGISFAYHEMRLTLTELLYNFDLELCATSNGWADNQRTFLLNEKVPLWMKLRPCREK